MLSSDGGGGLFLDNFLFCNVVPLNQCNVLNLNLNCLTLGWVGLVSSILKDI